jgi:hypothetical protein
MPSYRDEPGLLEQVQRSVAPFRVVSRAAGDGFVADLVFTDGRVTGPAYGRGPDPVLAVLAAEQRYLAEQIGRGSVSGATYQDKARERLRRWTELTPPSSR